MTALNECVMIVDDESLNVMWLTALLEDMGKTVCGEAASAEEAVRVAEANRPSLILMDLRLDGDGDGVDATLEIYERVGSQVIFVTGSTDPVALRRIESVNPVTVLTKPVSVRKLMEAVDQAFRGRPDGSVH